MPFTQSITLSKIEPFPIRASGGESPNMALGLMPTRSALLVRVEDDQGCYGWGEVWANFPPRANLHKAHLIEDVIAPRLNGFAFVDPQEAGGFLRARLATYFLHVGQRKVFEHLLAGLDMALWDLALRSAGRSFAEHCGPAQECAATYASSINPPDLEAMFVRHAGWGQTAFKLKIGFDDAADLAFVAKAAQALPAGGRLMVDNNQTWGDAQAEAMLKSLQEYDLLFAEEPIPADSEFATWEHLALATTIPLAVGENVYGIDRFLHMANLGVRYLQPDVAKWGGVSGALALAQVLPPGVDLWPHFMGTSVGQIAALSVAAAAGPKSVCEMDVNKNPLRTDLSGDVLSIHNGRVTLPATPGLVVPPTTDALSRFRDPPDPTLN